MFACPICGSANPPEQPSCSICGTIFAPPNARVPAAPPAAMQQTVVGHASPLAAPGAKAKQTLLGFGPEAPPAAPPAPQPAAPAVQRPLGRTVLGIGAPAGLAAPAPPQHTAFGLGPEAAAPAPALPDADVQAGLAPAKRTILGVARPGIAPLNPGVAKDAAPPAPYVPPPAPYVPPPAAVLPPARESETLPLPDLDEPLALRPRRSRLAKIAWLLVSAGLVVGVGLIAWALLRGGPTLQARLEMDEHGTEQLKLECSDCADGTTASLDGKTARFVAHQATLPLSRSLAIGDNELALTLTPPSGRARSVELEVPLQYRVRGDLKALADAAPKIRVWIEAEPGTQASIDGSAVPLAADGKGQHLVDVSRELTGASPSVARLEKKLRYELSPPGRDKVRGELSIQIGIVPLVVEAPGDDVVTDRPEFMLSGKSHRGATVSVSGRAITTDTSGGFAQLMSVSSTGETTIVVRADAPGMAPRLLPIRVKRVASLAAEAQRLKSGALDSYPALERADAATAARVALEGRLAEARVVNHRSILLLEMPKGCAHEPCLVRVLYGLAPPARKAQTAKVYGRLTGRVPGLTAGSTIPEVRADIVLLGS